MDKLSNWFRGRRDILLRSVITDTKRSTETLRILDLGGRGAYWRRLGLDFLREQKVKIDILNLTDAEMYSIEEGSDVFTYIVGDACKLDMADNSYDLCHANSVVEHVGLWWNMQNFAREVRRIAPNYYIQSPNFWFPIDPHGWQVPMQHWLPAPVRARLMQVVPIGHAGRQPDYSTAWSAVDSTKMLTRAQMRLLFPDAVMHTERLMLLPKSFTAIRSGK